MKRLTACLLLALFSLQGCAPDRYSIEKSYWKITNAAKRVFDNPNGVPPAEVNRVVTLLREFARAYPQSPLSVEAEFNVAHLYFAKRDYTRARDQLTAMLEKYAKNKGIGSEALFLIAISYQRQGRLETSTEQFKKLLAEYPESKRSFVLPYYFVRYYAANEMNTEASAALRDALEYYAKTAKAHEGTKTEFTMDLFMARCHMEMKDWKAASAEFNRIYDKYKAKGFNMEGVLFNLALLYLKELNDEARARETLSILAKEYPESEYISTARNLVKKMEQKQK